MDSKIDLVPNLVRGHRRDGRCQYDKTAKRELVYDSSTLFGQMRGVVFRELPRRRSIRRTARYRARLATRRVEPPRRQSIPRSAKLVARSPLMTM